jgi:hypothetical protein
MSEKRGRNKKWSKHKEKTFESDRIEKIRELAAQRGVEIWEIRPEDVESEESESDSEASEEEVKAKPKSKAVKKSSSEEEEEEEEEEESKFGNPNVRKGHTGLIEVANPNRRVKKNDEKVKLSRRELEELNQKKRQAREEKMMREGTSFKAKQDLARLAEIRAKREAAAKEREEKKQLQETKKAEAMSRDFKKR